MPFESLTKNVNDNGVQCSVFGPDVFPVAPPIIYTPNVGSSLDYIKHKDHFPPAKMKKKKANKTQVWKKICKK